MKKLLGLFVLLIASSRVAYAQSTWTQQLTDAISAGIAKSPDGPKITDWIQSVGTILALAIAIGVPLYQNRRDRSEDKKRHEAEVRSFLKAIRAEVQGAWDNYELMVRPGIRNVAPDGYVDFIFRFSDKAFPIYENSGVQVGKILDVDLQSQIVKAYGLAESLIASTEINNEMLKRLETPDQQQLGVVYVARPDVKKLLVQYAGTLRKIDAALETTVHDLIARLDRYVTQVP